MNVIMNRILGTPTNATWPGVQDLPDFKSNFPHWNSKDLTQVVSGLGNLGCDLLEKMLKYNPGSRLSAKESMKHPYFSDLDKSTLPAAII